MMGEQLTLLRPSQRAVFQLILETSAKNLAVRQTLALMQNDHAAKAEALHRIEAIRLDFCEQWAALGMPELEWGILPPLPPIEESKVMVPSVSELQEAEVIGLRRQVRILRAVIAGMLGGYAVHVLHDTYASPWYLDLATVMLVVAVVLLAFNGFSVLRAPLEHPD